MTTDFEYILIQSVLKELSKESFENSVHDICFLSQYEINNAVENGIKKVFEAIKEIKLR